MEEKQILLKSIDKLHTTEMGINRIKKKPENGCSRYC